MARGRNSPIFLCSFSIGWFAVRSPTGKQGLTFEDSEQFGPSKVDPRTSDLELIPDKHWFWKFYQAWREAGRPTDGSMSTPHGDIKRAKWVTS